jgi:hypothetical protein
MNGKHRLHLWGLVAVFAMAVAVVGGCGPGTTVQNVWMDPTYSAGPIKKAIVFGIVRQDGARRTLEDSFATALIQQGIQATPSYQLFPGDAVNKEEARAKVLAEGYDAVIVAKLGDKKQTTTYTGGGGYWGGYYGGWGGYDTGTVMTTEYVTFENTVWDPTGEGKLIWSATTETLNPNSGPKFASSLIDAVVPRLTRDGILPSTTPKK